MIPHAQEPSVPTYASVLETDALGREFYTCDDPLVYVQIGNEYWDDEERVLLKVIDVVVSVGQGVVRPKETPEEATADPEPERVRIVVQSDHPADQMQGIDGGRRKYNVLSWSDHLDERFVPHSANRWVPDELAR